MVEGKSVIARDWGLGGVCWRETDYERPRGAFGGGGNVLYLMGGGRVQGCFHWLKLIEPYT